MIKTIHKDKNPNNRYYTYVQNNSGGSFTGPAHYVIIKATSAKEANRIAEDHGLYFNGCDTGQDCDCCGDRWNEQYDDEFGTESPMIYGMPVNEYSGYGNKDPDILIIE